MRWAVQGVRQAKDCVTGLLKLAGFWPRARRGKYNPATAVAIDRQRQELCAAWHGSILPTSCATEHSRPPQETPGSGFHDFLPRLFRSLAKASFLRETSEIGRAHV